MPLQRCCLFGLVCLFLAVLPASAQRQMEKLGRGVVALHSATSQAYVGWRLLATDPTDVGFNQRAGSILRDRLERATVVVVSHQAATLEKFCRQAAVLHDGKLYMFDTLEEAKRLYDYQTQG